MTVNGDGVRVGSVQWSFRRGTRTPGLARAAVRRWLDGWGVGGDAADVAELLLSELVTNAVRHARRPPGRLVTVGVELSPGRLLRVEVADASEAPPRARETPGPEDEGGRGLLLVESLAAAWGTYPRRHVGKAVWFTLRLGASAGEGGLGALGLADGPRLGDAALHLGAGEPTGAQAGAVARSGRGAPCAAEMRWPGAGTGW